MAYLSETERIAGNTGFVKRMRNKRMSCTLSENEKKKVGKMENSHEERGGYVGGKSMNR